MYFFNNKNGFKKIIIKNYRIFSPKILKKILNICKIIERLD